MESSESDPLQEENLASIRRKNTLLIAILLSFIVSLSLIIGGSVIYLVLIHDSTSNSQFANPALNGFCSVAESHSGCIVSLSSHNTKHILFADPIHVYTFALESALDRLSRIVSSLSNNCSTSLRAATGRIDRALAVMRVDPGNETLVFEERRGMVGRIVETVEELRSCRESTAVGEAGRTRLHRIELLLGYCRDYLLECDLVDRRFRFNAILRDMGRSRKPILGLLADSGTLFGLQYFAMVFLSVLILLRCNFCILVDSVIEFRA